MTADGVEISAADSTSRSTAACERCRQKKRKCDREIPSCLKCLQEQTECVYSETNRRGIPVGYLNRLEARLAETEAVLFNSLGRLYSTKTGSGHTDVPLGPWIQKGAAQGKKEKMDEWESLPLSDDASIQNWLLRKAEDVAELGVDLGGAGGQASRRSDLIPVSAHVETSTTEPAPQIQHDLLPGPASQLHDQRYNPDPVTPAAGWLSRDDEGMRVFEDAPAFGPRPQSSHYSPDSRGQPSTASGMSKAEELSRARSNIYF